jgi:hypothetical protein
MSWQRTRGLYETLSHVTFESRDVPGAELHTNTDMWGVLEPGGQVLQQLDDRFRLMIFTCYCRLFTLMQLLEPALL